MIAVNVTRSWPDARTPQEQEEAMAGRWTLRETINLDDVKRLGDVLIASKRNRVVAVRSIQRIFESEPGRVCFDLAPAGRPWEALLGAATPTALAWRRGEVWPIKGAPTLDIELPEEPTSVPTKEPIVLGKFRITIMGDSTLVIHAPRGASVQIVSAQ